jgi:hypothetical protein
VRFLVANYPAQVEAGLLSMSGSGIGRNTTSSDRCIGRLSTSTASSTITVERPSRCASARNGFDGRALGRADSDQDLCRRPPLRRRSDRGADIFVSGHGGGLAEAPVEFEVAEILVRGRADRNQPVDANGTPIVL